MNDNQTFSYNPEVNQESDNSQNSNNFFNQSPIANNPQNIQNTTTNPTNALLNMKPVNNPVQQNNTNQIPVSMPSMNQSPIENNTLMNNPLLNANQNREVSPANTVSNTFGQINQPQPLTNNPFQSSNNNTNGNQFINVENNYNETSLNDLNVDGTYNHIKKEEAPNYVNDPQVQKNLSERKKGVTVKVTQEMKFIIIIAVIMLVFIIIMPTLFEWLQNLRLN